MAYDVSTSLSQRAALGALCAYSYVDTVANYKMDATLTSPQEKFCSLRKHLVRFKSSGRG